MRNEMPAVAVWITGLPASGKSRITTELSDRMKRLGMRVAVLESDAMRRFFATQPRYDDQDREYFYGSLALIGKTLVDNGISVIFDATANRRAYRDRARSFISEFFEVYVDTPLDVCIKRDPKGIYKAAQAGTAQSVPGLGAEYEAPEQPELVIHGDRENPADAAERILDLFKETI
jgi:adenylylsulfate kinase